MLRFSLTRSFIWAGTALTLVACSGAGTPAGDAQAGGSGAASAPGGASGVTPGAAGSTSSAGASSNGAGASSVAGSAGGVTVGGVSAGGGSSAGAVIVSTDPPCDRSMATWTDSDDLWASNDYGPSFLRKNFWNNLASGAGNLTLWAASSSCWGADAGATDTVKPGTVKSYPDMARGWVIGSAGFQNPNSGLPIQVQDLRKAKIHWNMAISGSPLRQYALWDIYFHETAMPGKGTAPVNLMIKQRVTDPSMYEQNKESAGASAVTQTFSGITFRENKQTGLSSGSRIVVELFATPVNGTEMGVDNMTLDLKEVIDHYVQDGSIRTTDYLTSIQAGWEIVAGGTFVTKGFWTALQDEPEPK